MDMKEVTNMLSPNTYKEFSPGCARAATSPSKRTTSPKTRRSSHPSRLARGNSLFLVAQHAGRSGITNTGIWMFSGYVASLAPVYPLDDRITVTGAIKITGKPVLW